MQLQYGKCNSDPRVVDKRPYFGVLHTTDILAKDTISDRAPVVVIAASAGNTDAPTCNYATMGGMYYYIDDVDLLPGGRYALHMRLDVLTSYADSIKNLSAVVTRQAGANVPMLADGAYLTKSNIQVETRQFNRSPFVVNYNSDFCYVLSVVGGANT